MFLEIFLGLVAIIFSYGLYIKYVKWTFFERKGILQMPTSFPLGNFNEMIFQVNNLFNAIDIKNKLLHQI